MSQTGLRIFLCFIVPGMMLLCSSCSARHNKADKKIEYDTTHFMTDTVIQNTGNSDCPQLIAQDTIVDASSVSLFTKLIIDNKEMSFINRFLLRKSYSNKDFFDPAYYKGLEVSCGDTTLTKFATFESCDAIEPVNMCDFECDSIDQEAGFIPLIIQKGKLKYIYLNGFNNGCNGSFCNFGAVLVLKFESEKLKKGYLFAIDKSAFNHSKTGGKIVGDKLEIELNDFDKLNPILLFAEKIRLTKKLKSSVDSVKSQEEIGCLLK